MLLLIRTPPEKRATIIDSGYIPACHMSFTELPRENVKRIICSDVLSPTVPSKITEAPTPVLELMNKPIDNMQREGMMMRA